MKKCFFNHWHISLKLHHWGHTNLSQKHYQKKGATCRLAPLLFYHCVQCWTEIEKFSVSLWVAITVYTSGQKTLTGCLILKCGKVNGSERLKDWYIFFELWCLVASGEVCIWVSSTSQYYFFENWLMKLKCPILLKALSTIIQENYQSFYPSEPLTFARFNMRHSVVSFPSRQVWCRNQVWSAQKAHKLVQTGLAKQTTGAKSLLF